ncbi:hypothetical protein DL98DRAFT_515651 [Cadophora sp. DSE1049]|nr:hypothetical protein DL98DRAFT_515651 [Cadophora sp. DSE1049]
MNSIRLCILLALSQLFLPNTPRIQPPKSPRHIPHTSRQRTTMNLRSKNTKCMLQYPIPGFQPEICTACISQCKL